MEAVKQGRQGDVLLVKVAKLPGGEGREEAPVNGRHILAHGEVTGHAHAVVVAPDAPLPKLKWFGQSRYLIAETAFDVVHEEHDAHHFEPGVYEVIRQFETDADLQQRQVFD